MRVATDASITGGASDRQSDGLLWFEYLRMLVVGTAGCGCLFWATRALVGAAEATGSWAPRGSWHVSESWQSAGLAVAFGSLIFGAMLPRRHAWSVGLLALMAITAASFSPSGIRPWPAAPPFFSPLIALAGAAFWLFSATASRSQPAPSDRRRRQPGRDSSRVRRMVTWSLVVAATCYLVVVPFASAVVSLFQEQPDSYEVPEATPAELIRIGTSKFLVFALFAYTGAAVGSFLHVVAASAPRGESVVLRSSCCPRCATPILRRDNWPIFSFLWLGRRCRVCRLPITPRYFWVEVVAAAIFGGLFLFQLIQAAPNVPGVRPYHATGIVWIILYTKWDMIGLYVYHASLFSWLLMLSLVERDRLRLPGGWAVGVTLALILPPAAFAELQPVAAWPGLGQWEGLLGAFGRVASAGLGAACGWLVGRLVRGGPGESLPLGMAWIGAALGWQASLAVGFGFAVFRLLAAAGVSLLAIWSSRVTSGRPRCGIPSALVWPMAGLLTVAFFHHFAWRSLVAGMAPLWPGPDSGWLHLPAILGLIGLIAAVRRMVDGSVAPPAAPEAGATAEAGAAAEAGATAEKPTAASSERVP